MATSTHKHDSKIRRSVYAEANAQAEKLLRAGSKTFMAVTAFALTVVAFYSYHFFKKTLSNEIGDWGVFGDYIGGVLNPAVGLATIYLVLINARLQRQELANSIAEMQSSNEALVNQNNEIVLQTFQSTFFNWMNSYRASIANVHYQPPSGGPFLKGAFALQRVYQYLLIDEMPRYFATPIPDPIAYSSLVTHGKVDDPIIANQFQEIILRRWKQAKSSHDIFIGETIRSIFGLLQWIENRDEAFIPRKTKDEHVQILRHQLSTPELVFLLYESTNFPKEVQDLMNRNAFFADLNPELDMVLKFMLDRGNST